MTWEWFTQSTPVSATLVASAADNANLAAIDQQVLDAYSPNDDVIMIRRANPKTYQELILLDRENSSPWSFSLGTPGTGWRYAIVMPDGSRYQLSPEEAQPGREYTYPISDGIYAALYNDLKEKYQAPLLTSDGTEVHRVWLYRYDTIDTNGIYPIVWESADGMNGSTSDGANTLERSVEVQSATPSGPVTVGGGPVSVPAKPATLPSASGSATAASSGAGTVLAGIALLGVGGLLLWGGIK